MKKNHTIKIIGGIHRSRTIEVIDEEGLRPTSSRMRETIFNWLQYDIAGSRCLDLFAGSGAMGIEALSRGAAFVQFIEKNREVFQLLERNIGNIIKDNETYQAINEDALIAIKNIQTPFDTVFIDPPFALNIHQLVFDELMNNQVLQNAKQLIIEFPNGEPLDDRRLQERFTLIKKVSTKESTICRYKNNHIVK